jgi:hypothetical protein
VEAQAALLVEAEAAAALPEEVPRRLRLQTPLLVLRQSRPT